MSVKVSNHPVLSLVFKRDIIKRSLIIAAVVGTILNLINQGDVMSSEGAFSWVKCVLTYMVPYCVSTYGAVSAIRSMSHQAQVSGTLQQGGVLERADQT